MITPLRALVRKDIQLFLADPRALIMSLIAPIAIASFFGYALGGSGSRSQPSRISVLVADQDGGAISRGIVERLGSEKALSVKPAAAEEARAAVRQGNASVAVIIPSNFGQEAGRAFFSASQKPEISVLYDPSHFAERSVVQGILSGDVMQVVSQEVFGGASGRTILKEALDRVESSQELATPERKTLADMLRSVERWNDTPTANAGPSRGLRMPYTTREEAVTSRQGIAYNGYAHAFAGMAVQFVLFLGIDIGIGLLLQRQRGLWKRLRAAPLSRATLLGSRILSAAILAFVIVLLNFLFARLVFGVRIEGSMIGFLCVAAAFALMTAAFGLLIATLGKTPDATRGLAILATLFMVMLGGAWVPMFLFPQWLQRVTVVMPTRWAIDGFEAMTWRGLGFHAALAPIALQLLFALVFATLALARFRWEAEG
jgi:ABC-type multidrug transport system permease subunit